MIIGAMDLSDRHSLGTSANVPQQAKNRADIMEAHFTSYNKASMPCSPVGVTSARSSAVCKPIYGGVGATPTGGAQHTLLKRCTKRGS